LKSLHHNKNKEINYTCNLDEGSDICSLLPLFIEEVRLDGEDEEEERWEMRDRWSLI